MNFSVVAVELPIPGFRRRHFSVGVCFAMTIKKAQGQFITGSLGIDITSLCFSYGQLYVTLSRTTSQNDHFIRTGNN